MNSPGPDPDPAWGGWGLGKGVLVHACTHGTLGSLDPKITCICADAPFGCRLRRGAALSSSSGRVALSTEAEHVPTP